MGAAMDVMEQPQKGDVLRIRRAMYDHFAVYIGDGQVIHRSGEPGQRTDPKAVIREDSLRDVARPENDVERANYLDNKHSPLSPDEIVKRARRRLGEQGYSLGSKNCEHFATWCRYGDGVGTQAGEGVSEQVNLWNNFGSGIVDDNPEYVLEQMPERGPKLAIP